MDIRGTFLFEELAEYSRLRAPRDRCITFRYGCMIIEWLQSDVFGGFGSVPVESASH